MQEDNSIIIKDEDDEGPQHALAAAAAAAASVGGQISLFSLDSSLTWPVSLSSPALQKLVDRRNEIIVEQRKAYFEIDELHESEDLVARTRPGARTPPAAPRALVPADALIGSYLLELEPNGALQVLVPFFVARGLTTWRTLSELKDPATARRLCADLLPAASGDVVEALLHFVQLVAR